jgi:hypothetical protein
MDVGPVVEIPVFAKITKFPADPKFTAAGPAASAAIGPITPTATETMIAVSIEFLLNFFICFYLFNPYRL